MDDNRKDVRDLSRSFERWGHGIAMLALILFGTARWLPEKLELTVIAAMSVLVFGVLYLALSGAFGRTADEIAQLKLELDEAKQRIARLEQERRRHETSAP